MCRSVLIHRPMWGPGVLIGWLTLPTIMSGSELSLPAGPPVRTRITDAEVTVDFPPSCVSIFTISRHHQLLTCKLLRRDGTVAGQSARQAASRHFGGWQVLHRQSWWSKLYVQLCGPYRALHSDLRQTLPWSTFIRQEGEVGSEAQERQS